jgi:hypothetical protein
MHNSFFTTLPHAPVTSKDKALNAVLLWIQTELPVIQHHSFVILVSFSRQITE